MGEQHDGISRPAAVAGYFYPGDARSLDREVESLMREGGHLRSRQAAELAARFGQESELPEAARRPLMLLLPHAGHVYSGATVCAALAGVELPRRLVILGPTHTGLGRNLGFWPGGAWEIPGGNIPVDEELGQELAALGGGFSPDVACHVRDHAIEVLLPFLRHVRPDCSILPVTVGMPFEPEKFGRAAQALAELLKRHETEEGAPRDLALIVSSDMNHFADETRTYEQDEAALRPLLKLDASSLLKAVFERGISMCGALPAALAIMACRAAGARHAHLCAHDTSASASGDTSRVVGYASVLVW
ncbi:MAG TPA: AmmeMemoRadiSam system protein B [Candidatus Mailhella merdavium]|nr:AmmeMemoRadiSam system protein B [Candidatus Mailhella merdavium]